MTDKPAMRSAEDESLVSFNLRVMRIRLQHRIDARLEEHKGDEQAAITSSGIGIGFLFATQISRSMEEALKEISRLQGALASQRVEPQAWQQIETAPVGERILVYEQGGMNFGYCNPKREWFGRMNRPKHTIPSHWMPIPAPPKVVTTKIDTDKP